MGNLTANQEAFIQLMTKSEEHARRGFELLVARPDFESFFDALAKAGLFDAVRNPAPEPASEPGYVRVPYWAALGYLGAVAKTSGDKNNSALARKVLDVIRMVSIFREQDGSIRDNYHTYRVFAEILGHVPADVITKHDLDLIPGWIQSRYERGMVGHALDQGVIRKLLASDSPENFQKAVIVLRHCTELRWVEDAGFDGKRKKAVSAVEDYWLKELIGHHAATFGAKIGRDAANVFVDRLEEVYGQDLRYEMSWLFRPAIEDHPQNHSWEGPENRLVEGLRDVLLAWVDRDNRNATETVEKLLTNANQIFRRIALYVIDQRWSLLKDTFVSHLRVELFEPAHLHELYNLLAHHFVELNDSEKRAVVECIRQIPAQEKSSDPILFLKIDQRNWLSAVVEKGFEIADHWFTELTSDPAIGSLSEHPDFHSYIESAWGPGPAPFQVQELLAFAQDGSLVERLNAFQQTDYWRGPSIQALVDVLAQAVKASPNEFIGLLPAFHHAKRAYQYGIVSGFKQLWEAFDEKVTLDWDLAWKCLIGFFEGLILDDAFWTESILETGDLTANRNWIPPLISEFLRAGTRTDEKAYSPELLDRTWKLVEVLVRKSDPVDNLRDDAMSQAINSSKGKAIEALFSHTLRVCRVSDRVVGQHAEPWSRIRPTFEHELNACIDGNYEFSTLAGAYVANLDYIDHEWLSSNFHKIFPIDVSANFECAIEGLAYAPETRPVYSLLVQGNIIDAALRQKLNGRYGREKILERIALAYLWGDEELDRPRFAFLFNPGNAEDLESIGMFFWRVSRQELTNEQVERVLLFWDRCVEWSQMGTQRPAKLLSSLSRLSCFLDTIGDREAKWLSSVAPYVHVGYNADEFIEQLSQLVDANPEVVSKVLGIVLDGQIPVYDFQGRLRALLLKLAEHGRRLDSICYTERLRGLQGMPDLYVQLTSGS